jgi:hypothetical protein
MSKSMYDDKTVTGNSKESVTVREKAAKFDAMENRAKEDNYYNRGQEQGANDAINSAGPVIENLMRENNMYKAVIEEGSLQDKQMQTDINRGINYVAPQEPGLMDSLGGLLDRAVTGASDWFTGANMPAEVQSQEQKDREFEQMQHDSEQAGLAELKQLLNKQQQ